MIPLILIDADAEHRHQIQDFRATATASCAHCSGCDATHTCRCGGQFCARCIGAHEMDCGPAWRAPGEES